MPQGPIYTVLSSLEELKTNMLEAINLCFEEQGKAITDKDYAVEKIFFYFKVSSKEKRPGKDKKVYQ